MILLIVDKAEGQMVYPYPSVEDAKADMEDYSRPWAVVEAELIFSHGEVHLNPYED